MSDRKFELKLEGGGWVEWDGSDGVNAAQRYADAHPGVTVTACRSGDRHGIFWGILPIVEPGDMRWGRKETTRPEQCE